mmetsp:Transcript_20420/g.50052  ORF Transcript_20420/g.50052 Transcript_20420/m.50052 type:complete len:871 (-) Transcript_20420:1456-4068(-)|eukprot:CAMPEP_0113622124 /NCGR_PEP_ID=MMETSP0017_2-20120614/11324_1 /TAXON_ID=2856 /ORGANISM="Cylindrotheca closterium" /LENGTH=870 /DNA_ID=CAMNT_0000531921 /DNA_START=850 /DNA_END=3462 /DNA_ORIENTATION=+ /assembly_acc=CAM_ASM_000147
MGSKKQKGSTKKKGPKGKKARAKAKLERQWGEVAIIDDEKNATKRIGKSRLKAQEKKISSGGGGVSWGGETTLESKKNNNDDDETTERASSNTPVVSKGIMKKKTSSTKFEQRKKNRRRSYNDSSSDESSSSDEESDNDETMAMNVLMSKIKKSMKKKKRAAKRAMEEDMVEEEQEDEVDTPMEKEVSSDDEEESEGSSESEDEEDNDASMPDDPTNADILDDDDASIENDQDESAIDIFRTRFSHKPLSGEEVDSISQPSRDSISIGGSTELLLTRKSIVIGDNELKDHFERTSEEKQDDQSKRDEQHWKKSAMKTLESSRKVLSQSWKRFNNNKKDFFTSRQAPLYTALSSYADLLSITSSMKERNELHKVNLLHVLNHVLTSRSRIQRHNKQLREIEKKSEENKEDEEMDNDDDDNVDGEKFRDQGFTRPTVLVVLPTRSTCHSFVEDLFQLTGNNLDNGMNERFEGEFGSVQDDEESEDDDKGASARRKEVMKQKGKDWNELFGDGVNQDDDFKLGIALTPKAAKSQAQKKQNSSNVGIKMYSDFYKSDIIVASPLGLKLLITPEDEEKEGDYDYLSSIEICLIQHSDVLMMQNWDHVNDVLSLLNQEPQNINNTDFSRVRNYLLEGQGAHWRQLIMSSNVMDPFLQSAFKRYGKSISGSIKMRRKIEPEEAAISNVLIPMKQVFQRVPAASFAAQSSARVKYFCKSILPQILESKQKHTMIYIPSYFDFCSLRNVFLKRDLTFVSVHEYSRTSEVSRGRARFLQGRKPIMLYTGRSNFFHRHNIKGVKHLVFLGLPEHPEFYSQHVNHIVSAENDPSAEVDALSSVSSCLVLCTKYEAIALERIVGSANCSRMLKSQKSTFMFYS